MPTPHAGHFGVGERPYGIAEGRFNSDRRHDLATADEMDETASVLLRK
ncbi:MAG: hypothetical protein AABM66_11830 [Actinomycetota bacterium]